MYQLVRAIFQNPDDKTKVTLVYGNRNEDVSIRIYHLLIFTTSLRWLTHTLPVIGNPPQEGIPGPRKYLPAAL